MSAWVAGASLAYQMWKDQQKDDNEGIDTRPWNVEQLSLLTPEQQEAYGDVLAQNEAPQIGMPGSTTPVGRTKLGQAANVGPVLTSEDLSIEGVDEALRNQVTVGQAQAKESLGKSEDLYAKIAEKNIDETRDAALRSKIDDIISQYGNQAVSGSRQLQAYGSDAGKYQMAIAQNKDSAIAKAVLENESVRDQLALKAAGGLSDVGATRGNIGLGETGNITDLIATQAQVDTSRESLNVNLRTEQARLDQEINIRQGELDMQRNKINADLASGDLDRIQSAKIANAQLEAQQRQLNLDKIANVQAIENFAYQGGFGEDANTDTTGEGSPGGPAAPGNPNKDKGEGRDSSQGSPI